MQRSEPFLQACVLSIADAPVRCAVSKATQPTGAFVVTVATPSKESARPSFSRATVVAAPAFLQHCDALFAQQKLNATHLGGLVQLPASGALLARCWKSCGGGQAVVQNVLQPKDLTGPH